MQISDSDAKKTERRLVSALTTACETAKKRIPGFVWLTHEVDYDHYPDSLTVIWCFDTPASMNNAIRQGQDKTMRVLTAEALFVAEVPLDDVMGHVRFRSE